MVADHCGSRTIHGDQVWYVLGDKMVETKDMMSIRVGLQQTSQNMIHWTVLMNGGGIGHSLDFSIFFYNRDSEDLLQRLTKLLRYERCLSKYERIDLIDDD